MSGITVDSLEQWWYKDWHGKTKALKQVCVPATFNINSSININIKIFSWAPESVSVSIDDDPVHQLSQYT
jgi:hypothetical protein